MITKSSLQNKVTGQLRAWSEALKTKELMMISEKKNG